MVLRTPLWACVGEASLSAFELNAGGVGLPIFGLILMAALITPSPAVRLPLPNVNPSHSGVLSRTSSCFQPTASVMLMRAVPVTMTSLTHAHNTSVIFILIFQCTGKDAECGKDTLINVYVVGGMYSNVLCHEDKSYISCLV